MGSNREGSQNGQTEKISVKASSKDLFHAWMLYISGKAKGKSNEEVLEEIKQNVPDIQKVLDYYTLTGLSMITLDIGENIKENKNSVN